MMTKMYTKHYDVVSIPRGVLRARRVAMRADPDLLSETRNAYQRVAISSKRRSELLIQI